MNTIILQPAAIYAFGRAIGWFILALLFCAGAILLLQALIFIAVPFAAIGAWRYLQLHYIRYEIGAEELKVRTGVLFRRMDHLEWFRVKDYIENQPLFLRMFRLMHLDLLTNDRTNPNLRLLAVPGAELATIIRERVQAARKNNPVVELE